MELDTSPLTFNLDFSTDSKTSSDYTYDDFEPVNLDNPEEYDYNFLME